MSSAAHFGRQDRNEGDRLIGARQINQINGAIRAGVF